MRHRYIEGILYKWIDEIRLQPDLAQTAVVTALYFAGLRQYGGLAPHPGPSAHHRSFGGPALTPRPRNSAGPTVKFSPGDHPQDLGRRRQMTVPADAAKQKKWLPSNFRLRIDGCESGCAKGERSGAHRQAEGDRGTRSASSATTSVSRRADPQPRHHLAESHADEVLSLHEDAS